MDEAQANDCRPHTQPGNRELTGCVAKMPRSITLDKMMAV
jgi:hypothetical protein